MSGRNQNPESKSQVKELLKNTTFEEIVQQIRQEAEQKITADS